jgi:hypothetical protein
MAVTLKEKNAKLRRQVRAMEEQIDMSFAQISDLRNELADSKSDIERGRAALSNRENMETQIGMLQSKLDMAARGLAPKVEPEDVVLLDHRSGERLTPRQQDELVRRYQDSVQRLRVTHALLGSIHCEHSLLKSQVEVLQESLAPFRNGDLGPGYICQRLLGFIQSRDDLTLQFVRETKSWLVSGDNGKSVVATSNDIDGLLKSINAYMLANMPDPE